MVPLVPEVAAVAVVVGPDVAVSAGLAPVPVVVASADVLGACVVAVSAGLLNRLPVEAAGFVVEVSAGFDVPRPPNRPPEGAAAGVKEGVAEDVVPPREKRGF